MNLKSRIHEATAFTDLLCQTSAQVAGAYEWADTKKFVVRHFREAWAEETVEGWGRGPRNSELSIETQDHAGSDELAV